MCIILLAGEIPEELSVLMSIFKGKGDILRCKNYREIKLLANAFKIWKKVIKKRDESWRFKKVWIYDDICNICNNGLDDEAIRNLLTRERHIPAWEHMVEPKVEGSARNPCETGYELCMRNWGQLKMRAQTGEEFGIKVGLQEGSASSPCHLLYKWM